MKRKDIILGDYYRLKSSPNFGWLKPFEMLRPREGVNITNNPIYQCEWSVDKDSKIRLVKYFKASDIVKVKDGDREPLRFIG